MPGSVGAGASTLESRHIRHMCACVCVLTSWQTCVLCIVLGVCTSTRRKGLRLALPQVREQVAVAV